MEGLLVFLTLTSAVLKPLDIDKAKEIEQIQQKASTCIEKVENKKDKPSVMPNQGPCKKNRAAKNNG